MITLWRIFKTGFRNLFRHAWLSAAATVIMVVTLVVVSFFIFAGAFLRQQLVIVKNKIDITIFLADTATQPQIQTLQNKILAQSNTKSVTFVSKADALKSYQDSTDPVKRAIAQSAAQIGNPLNASLDVRTADLNNIDSLVSLVRAGEASKVIQSSTIDDGNQRKKIIQNIGKISSITAKVGTIIGIAFLIISIMIIFNTIRMAIFTRREEIEIMQLVGATKWFIRGPFLVEGALYGVIGATLALVIIFPLVSVIKPAFEKYFGAGDVVQFFTDRTLLVVAFEYGVGVLIGILSSWLALMRHLKL